MKSSSKTVLNSQNLAKNLQIISTNKAQNIVCLPFIKTFARYSGFVVDYSNLIQNKFKKGPDYDSKQSWARCSL